MNLLTCIQESVKHSEAIKYLDDNDIYGEVWYELKVCDDMIIEFLYHNECARIAFKSNSLGSKTFRAYSASEFISKMLNTLYEYQDRFTRQNNNFKNKPKYN